jgi:hypothetical protein
MCLNDTYSEVPTGKYLPDIFPIQNGLKQGDDLSPLIFKYSLGYAIRKVQEKSSGSEIEWDTSASALC